MLWLDSSFQTMSWSHSRWHWSYPSCAIEGGHIECEIPFALFATVFVLHLFPPTCCGSHCKWSLNCLPMFVCSFSPGEDELEISPYDDTLMDTRMGSLVAGKTQFDTHNRTRTESLMAPLSQVRVDVHHCHRWSHTSMPVNRCSRRQDSLSLWQPPSCSQSFHLFCPSGSG